jgi:hypothetical protein
MKSLQPIRMTPGLTTHDCIVSYAAFPSNLIGHVNNALIMTKPNHPVLLDVIQGIVNVDVDESSFFFKEHYVFETTSPYYFDKVIRSHKHKVLFLDNSYYEPCYSIDPFCKPKANTIMDHQHELSWFSGPLKTFAYLAIYWFYLFLLCIPVFVLYMVFCKLVKYPILQSKGKR